MNQWRKKISKSVPANHPEKYFIEIDRLKMFA